MQAKRGGRKIYSERGPGARIKRQHFPTGTASAVHSAIEKLSPDDMEWYANNSEAIPTLVSDKGEIHFQGFQQHQFDPKMKKGVNPIRYCGGRRETSASGNANLDERIYRGLHAIAQDFGGECFQTRKIPKKQKLTDTTRMSTPWWVLNEDRFKNFIGRMVDPHLFEKVKKHGMKVRDVKYFRRASKSYIALSEFYLNGVSDEEILEKNPSVWPNVGALKQYRSALVRIGFDEYGTKTKPAGFVWNGRHYDLEWAIIRRSVGEDS